MPYFIYFDVPPENIDVNIHPTKTEIKFENEQAIWQILAATVKEAVGMFNDIPAIDFDTQGRPDIPVFGEDGSVEMPKVNYNPQYNPFDAPSQPSRPKAEGWENLYDGLENRTESTHPSLFTPDEEPSAETPAESGNRTIAEKSLTHYQYKGMYIMTAVKSGLMIVDQHRAHFRILYEKYLGLMRDGKAVSQKILYPEAVHCSATEAATLAHILPELEKLGFELSDLGSGTYAVNAVPVGLEGLNIVKLILDLVGSASQCPVSVADEVNSAVASGLARNAAIVYGQVLSNEEMEDIVNSLFACQNFNYTPDGKKILGILRQTEIENLLG